MSVIQPPKNCPCCNSELVIKNDQLYCINPTCEATQHKAVEHFAKTLKIKGLGPATITKLNLYSIMDIYSIDLDTMIEDLGSEKMAVKLYEEIEQSKQQPLNAVLPAFGIPLIGKTATDKLAMVCKDIYDIDADTCKQAGLGEKATSNILNWLDNNDFFISLPMSLKFEEITATKNTDKSLGVVCISGKLNSYSTKQKAREELERLGYIVKDSMTKDVTILVNESGKETQKTQKARLSGITIVENLKDFIGDNT